MRRKEDFQPPASAGWHTLLCNGVFHMYHQVWASIWLYLCVSNWSATSLESQFSKSSINKYCLIQLESIMLCIFPIWGVLSILVLHSASQRTHSSLQETCHLCENQHLCIDWLTSRAGSKASLAQLSFSSGLINQILQIIAAVVINVNCMANHPGE